MKHRVLIRTVITCLVVFVLATCAPAATQVPAPTTVILTDTPPPAPTAKPTQTTAPSPTTEPTNTLVPTATTPPDEYSGIYQVGDFGLEIFCKGTGEPTIILENGLNLPGTELSWTDRDLLRFQKTTRTCRYLRAGMNEGNVMTGWRTTQDQVNDLHALLQQAGVPGPYILVAHSLGGSNIIMYSGQYPEDVAGLVCVDCRLVPWDKIFLEKVGPESPDDSDEVKEWRNMLLAKGQARDPEGWKGNPEGLDIDASDAQVWEVTSLGDLPFVLLVQDDYWVSSDMDKLWYEVWLAAAEATRHLSTHSRLEVVPNTDHDTIRQSPSVYLAIMEVYNAVKQP